ncbi:MAG TPA: transporter substrate-binding domain-containing protein [Stellaceae bacterium]|nr:transporter substrate-binding domain-containing protein [Stellaceae bacterium]
MRRVLSALCGTLIVVLLAPAAHAESALETVLKRGQFIAGITADSPPSGYVDAQGHTMGYCADVARYLSRRLGVTLQFVQVTAASRVPLLQTGRIDAEVAVTTPNKVRNEVVDFALTYIMDNGVLVVRTGDSTDLKDYANSSKVIGATQGNGFVDRWKLLSPQAQFKLFQDEGDVVVALKNKQIDAYITGSFLAARFVKSGGIQVAGVPWASSPDAIMVRDDDSKWRKWLNWALQRMWVEGTFQKLYVKWYGIEPDFPFGDAGLIQPRVTEIGKADDPWHDLPAGFMDKLLSDKSYELDQ